MSTVLFFCGLCFAWHDFFPNLTFSHLLLYFWCVSSQQHIVDILFSVSSYFDEIFEFVSILFFLSLFFSISFILSLPFSLPSCLLLSFKIFFVFSFLSFFLVIWKFHTHFHSSIGQFYTLPFLIKKPKINKNVYLSFWPT